jgi:hypothetical protein
MSVTAPQTAATFAAPPLAAAELGEQIAFGRVGSRQVTDNFSAAPACCGLLAATFSATSSTSKRWRSTARCGSSAAK